MQLCNKYNEQELVAQLKEKGHHYVTVSFYKYAHIPNPQLFRDHLYSRWSELEILGRVYVAKEGINAQISIPNEHFDDFRKELETIDFLQDINLNIAVEETVDFSFIKLKIKVRPKILADGLNDDSFDVTNTGNHLSAEEFNNLTDDKETILIDFRNHYESEVGHFKGAILPDVDTFRDSLPYIEEKFMKGNEDKNIIMYCTGGIRCEKASAWFKHIGYKKVHMVDGGIIKYANECKEKGLENKYIGQNFVFDERRVERISDDVIAHCHQCGKPFDVHTNCANEACHLLFIQCDECKAKYENCCSEECQHHIHLPLEEQKRLRKGHVNSNKIFKKGRSENLPYMNIVKEK